MRAVTLDCSVRFLSPGRIGVPLDAEVELLRETKRLAFFAGKVVQDGELVAAFTGALRKSSRPVRPDGTNPPRHGEGTSRRLVEGLALTSPEQPLHRPAAPAVHLPVPGGIEALMTPVADRYRALHRRRRAPARRRPGARGGRARRARRRARRAAAEGQHRLAHHRPSARSRPAASISGAASAAAKSMLMDLAFETIDHQPKRRVHFHEFMLEVHERLRAERAKEEGDPIPPVAKAIADEARLLCFDEMVINNSADAMILSRLFAHLLEAGVTVITTSNRPPNDLYLGGLNRELFLPFIHLVDPRSSTSSPLNGPTDYRLERLGGMPTWYVPNGAEATAALRHRLLPPHRLSGPRTAPTSPARSWQIPGGRTLHVPKSLKGVAVFSFRRLCGEPRGARRLSRHRPPLITPS